MNRTADATMKRNPEHLHQKTFDLIIIGGGIYGAWAAWDATLRGLSVALFEKDDFGSATSSNSLKIIHGGLRYLQHADFKRMRESVRERMILMRVAPHLVHPLPCIMPTYGHGVKGREALAIALFLNDLITFDRNKLSDPQKYLPKGRILSRKELLEKLPGIETKNLTGGAMWYDCQIYNSERLLIGLLAGASSRGATVVNYAPVTGFLVQDGHVRGVRVQDRLAGRQYEIFSQWIINTSGPWVNKLLNLLPARDSLPHIHFSKAMNLVVKRKLIDTYGVGIPSKYSFQDADALIKQGSRLLFMTPWRNYTLIGTTHVPYEGDPDAFAITEEDIQELLQEYNLAYPARSIRREDITHAYGGLLPMEPHSAGKGHVTLTKHYKLIDHEKEHGLKGLITVVGVKYTTARDVAARAVDIAVQKLGRRERCRTDQIPIPGGNIDRFGAFLQEEIAKRPWNLSEAEVRHLVLNYGREYPKILQYLEEDVNWRERVDPEQEVLYAEVVHAVREEMAQTLLDVIRRRTELGSAGCPPDVVLEKVARLVASELGWDEAKIQEEIRAAQAYYQIPGQTNKVPSEHVPETNSQRRV